MGGGTEDPWEQLRPAEVGSARWRGSWRPTRAAAPSRAPADDHVGPAGHPALDGLAPGSPTPVPTLRWPHAVVVALVGLAAIVGTGLVLWTSQPRAESVPLASTASPTSAPLSGSAPSGSPPSGSAPSDPPASELLDVSVTPAPPPSATAEPVPDVVVHVVGRVRRPGVVVLPAGSRVVDALSAAGGSRPGTSLTSVNLARVLVDGEQVRVGLPPDPALQAAEPPPGPGGGPAGSAPVTPIDLNQADVAALDTLPGIGPVLAQRIVEWREQNGPFASLDQLLEVSGIGPSVLADLDGKVRV
jgi:competence protein ComEA